MSKHPVDKTMGDLFGSIAKDGIEKGMENWLKDLQEEVGAPDGPELPETIEVEYSDGTKETFDTTKPRFGPIYDFDNPHPLDKVAFPDKDESK